MILYKLIFIILPTVEIFLLVKQIRQSANKIYKNVFDLFDESKFISEITVSKTGELYYKNLAFILTDLEKKINKGKVLIKSSGASRSMEKNYYKTDSFTLLKDLYKNQLKIS